MSIKAFRLLHGSSYMMEPTEKIADLNRRYFYGGPVGSHQFIIGSEPVRTLERLVRHHEQMVGRDHKRPIGVLYIHRVRLPGVASCPLTELYLCRFPLKIGSGSQNRITYFEILDGLVVALRKCYGGIKGEARTA